MQQLTRVSSADQNRAARFLVDQFLLAQRILYSSVRSDVRRRAERLAIRYHPSLAAHALLVATSDDLLAHGVRPITLDAHHYSGQQSRGNIHGRLVVRRYVLPACNRYDIVTFIEVINDELINDGFVVMEY